MTGLACENAERPAGPEVTRADPDALRATLERVAAGGGYFTLVVGERDPGADLEPPWRPSADLYAGPGPRSPLAGLIDTVADRLAARERRVAASIAQLGYAARLWSVALGAAVSDGRVPDLAPADLRWRQAASGAIELRIDRTTGWELAGRAGGPADPDRDRVATLAGLVHRAVIDRHLVPLAAAVAAEVSISPRIVWGNAASALVGASRMLESEPEAAPLARALTLHLLGRGPLRGAGTVVGPRGPATTASFVRRSCCLFYRIPGGGTCGDCVLLEAAAAR